MQDYELLANAVRILSADSVEKAKSGHPGMPMGMAEIAVTLWKDHFRHNPANPEWLNRDRFILSNGHGSMLLYSMLHLTGYDLSIDDLQHFRQLGSKTPGHPEYGYTPGVETTTGPLGQGIANAVGMALAQKLLAAEFNRPNYSIIDNFTYVFVGDGCLMEGISHEACSLAGTLGLSKLIVIYDDNGISIDGEVENWFSEDVAKRFESYNWQVIKGVDGHCCKQIDKAIKAAKHNATQPTLIICKTIIGKGAPNKAGKEECHGSPLGDAELVALRQQLNWPYEPFIIPDNVYAALDAKASGSKCESEWQELFNSYRAQYPDEASELMRRSQHELPANFASVIDAAIALVNKDALAAPNTKIATRKTSQKALDYYAKFLPELFGGSADLTGSNLTNWHNCVALSNANNFTGNYLSYGVREFAMSAIINGMYLYGGFRPFAGTFLMFSEYARNALRMASLMKIAPIFVYTHDSIGLGEDGPTHQPVEQLASLRLIPNMHVWRPADALETMVAWGMALSQKTTPSCLIFSRQNLPYIAKDEHMIKNVSKGGYILRYNHATPDIVIFATGSEVQLAYQVYEQLALNGLLVQLVSMPSTSVFDEQTNEYKQRVLSKARYKIAIEAGVADSWYKYVGTDGLIVSIDTFGESAPGDALFNHFGFSCEQVLTKIRNFLAT